MKRNLLLFFSIIFIYSLAIAQDGINYQGAATDANGDELTNQNISIRASILSGSANGDLQWEETHSVTTDQFGLFNLVIGQGTNTTNGSVSSFDEINWGSANHYLMIEMDASGGSNYSMIGTSQMMSVPYALYAKNAGLDSTAIAAMIGSSGGGMGGGCDYSFPDGLDGDPIIWHLPGNDYTVPAGKNLYITAYMGSGNGKYLRIDGKEIMSNGGDYHHLKFKEVIVVGAGSVVSSPSQTSAQYANFNGILVDASVTPITWQLPANDYTVPNGKKLFITSYLSSSSQGFYLKVDGQEIMYNGDERIFRKVIVVGSGSVVSTPLNTNAYNANFNGYLVDENYFADCGGGGGSSSSASAVDSAMVAGMIANASGGGTGDWELLYDCLNCGQNLPWGTIDRFGVADTDGFLYVIGDQVTITTGDDFDSSSIVWNGTYNTQLLLDNAPSLIPLKKDMNWHIQFHSTQGEVSKAYFIPNSGGGSSTASSSGNGSGCDFKYPDGLDGDIVNLDLSSPYTVPNGKTLYLTHVFLYSDYLEIDGERIIHGWSNAHNLNGNNAHPASNGLNSPILVGSGSTISAYGGLQGNQQVQGILMSEGVEVMNLDLNSAYTVPSGKRLYLTNVYLYGDYLNVDGERIIHGWSNAHNQNSNAASPPSNGLNTPLIIDEGSILSVEGGLQDNQQVNGYLVNEDYFANCGGAGSSSSSSINDNLPALLSNQTILMATIPSFLSGDIVDTIIPNQSSYTVPTGKQLFCQFANTFPNPEPIIIDGQHVSCSPTAGAESEDWKKLIMDENEILSFGIYGSLNLHGVLVDKNNNEDWITIVLDDVNNLSYTVPAGKNIFINSVVISCASQGSYNGNLEGLEIGNILYQPGSSFSALDDLTEFEQLTFPENTTMTLLTNSNPSMVIIRALLY